ncbi:YiiX/YebB-like N1pC/P60 family cysteine hydrolase [uncultured Algibacter sp.]|uniref:YiiX/YebB-like N1pC/P60 family cysteine hydrolase n=1 Tax=uncultured Algibacter sp. TaxID=298659 RepID=UPI00260730DA|nr:YiiX/YebB-like N1pC/P60 family cysteine hydrolase [uncultured Algibacter sp.]
MIKITQKIIYSVLSIMLLFLSCKYDDNNKAFKIQEGDLLFQDTGTDDIDNAIKSVTATSLSKNYSHVGMAMQTKGMWFVIEAIPLKGITKTPLQDFLDRNKNDEQKSQTTVARLNENYQKYIPKAIEYGISRLKTPYDDVFLWDDNTYYCSELIYKMFSFQNLEKNSIPFVTHPMTFKDSTGKTSPSWIKYYKELKQPIPEGDIGTNPNLMAGSQHIRFIYDYAK